jgi:glycosyltransferase involved in cell wall biosynthesis
MGIPVISTNTGGLSEVNLQGQTGFLSAVGDIDNMAANTMRVLRDEETYKRFSENAKQQAGAFDISKILPLYEKLYARFSKHASEN